MNAFIVAAAMRSAGTVNAETLGDGWSWRRPLVFHQALSDAPGENCAWVEFYGNGAQAADWADLRITTADRVVMPHKVLAKSDRGDFVRVAFATRSDGPYYAWWGNSKASKPPEELAIQRGIYVEATSAAGRPAQQLFGRGRGSARGRGTNADGEFLGGYFLPELSVGFDPLGEQRAVMLHYAAQFRIERPLKPQVAFTVSGAGVLEIDNKEVAQDRGGVNGRVRSPVPMDFGTGWHSIDVKQMVQAGQQTVLSVVWQRPGEQAYSVLPAAAIAPVAHAVPGALEKTGAAFTPDLSIEPLAEGFIPPNDYALRYELDVNYPSSMKPSITWDFGDGQATGTGAGLKKMSHIFLTPGVYAVKATLETAGGAPMITTVRLEVKDRLYEKFPRPPEDPAKAMSALFREYEPSKLSSEAILRGISFFQANNDADATLAWGKAWLEKKEAPRGMILSDTLLEDQTVALARLAEGRRQYATAAEFYRLASAKPVRMEMRLKMMWLGVAQLCDNVGDPDKALQEARTWEKKIDASADGQVALLQGAIAYAAIANGDEPTAKAAVSAAEEARARAAITSGGTGPGGATFGNAGRGAGAQFNEMQIRQGVLARNVENYIRTKDFDTAWKLINEWDMEMPSAAWEGFTRTLRVKLAAAEGRPLAAAQMALAHAKANPSGFYAAELLLRASENFQAAGKGEESRTVMEMLRTKYPESPYAQAGK